MDFVDFELCFLKNFNNLLNATVGKIKMNGVNCYYYTRQIHFEKDIIDLSIIPHDATKVVVDKDTVDELFNNMSNVDTITFYNIENEKINYQDVYFRKYYSCKCVVENFKYKSVALKNIRKFQKELEISVTKTHSEYIDLLKLGNKKIETLDLDEIIHRQADFLYLNKGIISFNIKLDGQIVAGIVCKHNSSELDMICCNYDVRYIKYCLCDALYSSVIEWSRDSSIANINWGNVAKQDIGVLQFKKKYSTNLEEEILCHIFRKHN